MKGQSKEETKQRVDLRRRLDQEFKEVERRLARAKHKLFARYRHDDPDMDWGSRADLFEDVLDRTDVLKVYLDALEQSIEETARSRP